MICVRAISRKPIAALLSRRIGARKSWHLPLPLPRSRKAPKRGPGSLYPWSREIIGSVTRANLAPSLEEFEEYSRGGGEEKTGSITVVFCITRDHRNFRLRRYSVRRLKNVWSSYWNRSHHCFNLRRLTTPGKPWDTGEQKPALRLSELNPSLIRRSTFPGLNVIIP